MTNNYVLRQLRYTFDCDDAAMISIFGLGGLDVTRAEVSDWLKKDDDPAFKVCEDEQLATFLNGLISHMRGKKEGPTPAPEKRLTNNIILRKLRIALNLQDTDMHAIMVSVDMPLSKPELSALFRRADHKHYRECKDQLLRRFLRGMQHKYRPGSSPLDEEEESAQPEA